MAEWHFSFVSAMLNFDRNFGDLAGSKLALACLLRKVSTSKHISGSCYDVANLARLNKAESKNTVALQVPY